MTVNLPAQGDLSLANESSSGSAPLHSRDLRSVGLFAAFGAAGGVVSFILSLWLGEPVPFTTAGALGASALFGAAAALLGIFAVFNTDTRAFTRALILALLFGLCWKPTLEASKALIEQKKQERAERQALAKITEAKRALAVLSSAPNAEVDATAAAAVTKYKEALDAAQRIDNRKAFDALAHELSITTIQALNTRDKDVQARFRKALERNAVPTPDAWMYFQTGPQDHLPVPARPPPR